MEESDDDIRESQISGSTTKRVKVIKKVKVTRSQSGPQDAPVQQPEPKKQDEVSDIVQTPDRFGKTLLSKIDKRESPVKITTYNPHASQNDVVTKLLFSIQQEERRNAELKQRLEAAQDPERDETLHQRKRELTAQLELLNKEQKALEQQYKQVSLKQTQQLQGKRKETDIEYLRNNVRALTATYLKKKDKLEELDKQLKMYQTRADNFEKVLPVLHNELETGGSGIDDLVLFLKNIQSGQMKEAKDVEVVDKVTNEQTQQLEKAKKTLETAKRALEKQKEVQLREEYALAQQVGELSQQKDELEAELTALKAKFDKIKK